MAVQIGLQGYPLGPSQQFLQHPPPSIPPPALVPGVSFGVSQSVTADPVTTQQKNSLTSASPLRSANVQSAATGGIAMGGSFDGRRMRSKSTQRRTVDYNASLINFVQNRIWQRDSRDMRALQPDALYNHLLVPPAMLLDVPVNAITTRSVRTATNKIKCPVFCTCWTPEGRRLVTGASSGEFTLWNGLTFSFETILQAHDTAVRSMIWSHNDQWMLTGDHGGFVKYWQSNMNNVKMYQAHKDPVRGLSFCPSDQKFASCSDDGTVRVWDFFRCYEEKILRGHGADVKCVDWHPHKSLLASGSKDTQQPVKLWDPRSGSHLATIHAHKHTVMDLKWNKNGNWLLTASRDHLLKLFDIRNMKEEIQSFRGHKKEATTIAWHPIHECLFASGGSDGAIMFWLTSNDKEIGSIDEAHETMVWSLSWHPLGHVLVSGSNDHTTKFWTRNRLGDSMRDRYNLNNLPFGATDDVYDDIDHPSSVAVPGLGSEFFQSETTKKPSNEGLASEAETAAPAIPGLDFSQPKHEISNDDISAELHLDPKAAAAAAAKRKAIYTKPVPKAFERAWAEGRPTAGVAAAEPSTDAVPLSGLLGDTPDEVRPPPHPHNASQPPPSSAGSGRWSGSGSQSSRHTAPLPAPLSFVGSLTSGSTGLRPSSVPAGQSQPNAVRGSLRPSAPPRPLLSIPSDGWQQPHSRPDVGRLDDVVERETFDEYGDFDNYSEEQPHGDVDYRIAGPGPDQNMRPSAVPGPGSRIGHEMGPGVRTGTGMGLRGSLRGPGFHSIKPLLDENTVGGAPFGRRPPPANQEGPSSRQDFQSLGQPLRFGMSSGGPTKPPSLLDIQVKPTLSGAGLKRKWESEVSGPHDNFSTESRLGGEGLDGGQFGQMSSDMMNRGPMPPSLLDDELLEGPPAGHLGRGRGFFRGGVGPSFSAGNAIRGRGMHGGRGR